MALITDGNGTTAAAAVRKDKRNAPKLRTARFEDYDQITRLESRYGLPAKPYEEWVHLWQGNPVYLNLGRDWPIGWVLEDEHGQIVGSMGNIPFLYELEGRRMLVASGHNWVAELAHRSTSLLLLYSLINQPSVDLYLNSTVTDSSIAAVTALGCSRVPVGVWDEVAYWITDYVGCFRHILRTRNPFAVPLREGVGTQWKAMWARLSRAGRQPFSLARFLKGGHFAKPSVRESDIEVKDCPDFDDRFDTFWEELKKNNPRLLLAVRTREILEWHFRYALLGRRLWIVTVVDGRRLLAYAIFIKIVNRNSGVKQAKLVDYQSLDNSTSMLEPLLSWALRRCRSERVQMLEFTGRWLESGGFFDSAPYRRALPAWQYFYRANNPRLRELLNDKYVWAPSLLDSDAAL
jgi:hypothetical protein